MIDEAVGADFLEKQGGVEVIIVESIPGDDLFGFAVAPDNDALREAMNEALATIKEDGTMAELYAEVLRRRRATRQGPRGHERAAHGRLATNGKPAQRRGAARRPFSLCSNRLASPADHERR